MKTEIYISTFCGLCKGAENVIEKVKASLKEKKNVVVYKEILHNKRVMSDLISKGATLKNNIEELTNKDYVIIRAHGEPYTTYEYLESNNIEYLDCTCPNVKAIHALINQKSNLGYKIIIIGKHNHPEVEGNLGWATSPLVVENEEDIKNLDLKYDKYYLVVQTTFNKDKADLYINEIKNIMKIHNKVFEHKNTICNAQKSINISATELAKKVDVMIVIGGKNSSNSKELYDNVSKIKETHFIENPNEVLKLIQNNIIVPGEKIGISAGASTMKEDILKLKEILNKNLN